VVRRRNNSNAVTTDGNFLRRRLPNIPLLIRKINPTSARYGVSLSRPGDKWNSLDLYSGKENTPCEPKVAPPDLKLPAGEKFLHVDRVVLPANIDHSVIGFGRSGRRDLRASIVVLGDQPRAGG